MNSPKEFLEELAEELRYLPASEVNDILKHYKDRINVEIDYGTPLDKIFTSLKSPQEIAKGIYEMKGINYLKKRKARAKVKDGFVAVFCGLLVLACLLIFIVGAIFIGSILVNQVSLIIYSFSFNDFVDTILTTIFVLAYFLIMIVASIYIIDLFIILINSLLLKILNCFEKTRGKYKLLSEFTFTELFNNLTKTKKFLLKFMAICAIVFIFCAISSYATKGYMYRSMNNVNSKVNNIVITEDIDEIIINANNTNVTFTEKEGIKEIIVAYEYELSKMNYNIDSNKLIFDVEKSKTYDILGFIKVSTSHINITLPTGYDLNNINIDIEYGTFKFTKISNNTNVDITTINGNVLLGENSFNKVDLEVYTGTINSNKNTINELIINHQSGEFNAGEDSITKFEHTNGSSQVIMVNSKIIDYKLNNSSGTIYLEKLSGEKVDILSNTSINKLYDLLYNEAKIIVQNTANLLMTRCYFINKLESFTLNNSYQTLDFVKSPSITIGSNGGLVTCTNINDDYLTEEIIKLKEEYRDYATIYNSYKVENAFFYIEAKGSNATIDELLCNEFKLEQYDAASTIDNVNCKISNITFSDTASTINEFYADTMNLIVKSSNFTSKSSIDIYNKNDTNLIINVEADGMSDFVTSDHIEVIHK